MQPLRHPVLWIIRLGVAACALLPGQPAAGGEEPGPLELAKPAHDYGVVQQNTEYAAEIGYRNTGQRAVEDIRVKADCGCYSADLSHTTLAPGTGGTLRVRFRTLSFHGDVAKTLRLTYNDGAPRMVALRLKLRVVGGVVVFPGRLHFGDVLAGTKPAGNVRVVWYQGAGKPFAIKSIDVQGEPIETRIEPYAHPEKKEWKGWRVHFSFTQPPPKGVYSKKAFVHTTHPTQRRVVVPLTAHVVGKVWVQSSRIYLGLLPQGRAKSAAIMIRGFDRTIQLGKVTARARKGILKTSVEDAMGPFGPHKKLRVHVPADAPPGPLDDVIELRTEVPGEEVTEIDVRGRIFKPSGR